RRAIEIGRHRSAIADRFPVPRPIRPVFVISAGVEAGSPVSTLNVVDDLPAARIGEIDQLEMWMLLDPPAHDRFERASIDRLRGDVLKQPTELALGAFMCRETKGADR